MFQYIYINMRIIITEEQKKKLFIPRNIDKRYSDWNKEQPIVNGIQINQYDSEGNKQGYWENYNTNGKIESKGNYINNIRDGYWEYYYPNGQLFIAGGYNNNQLVGEWLEYFDNGDLASKGSYKNSMRDGDWFFYHDGNILYAKRRYINGILIETTNITESEKPKKLFIPRKLEGKGSRWEQWNNSQPTINGKKINQYDLNGKPIGYWDDWIDDEMVSGKGFFIKGLKHGMWEEYLSGELIGKGIYKNGKETGIWEFYDDGELSYKRMFENGISIGRWNITKDNLTEGVSYSYTLDKTHNDPTKREIIYKFKNRDNYEFEVLFYNLGNGKWEREYRTNEKGLGLLKTNDVFNIIETVTEITIDFIEKYEPNKIIITHIPKNKEVDFNNPNKPNKRALLNKRYLKPAIDKLDDYFYYLKGSTSVIEKI